MELSYYISEIRQALPVDWMHLDDRMIIRLINQFRTVTDTYNFTTFQIV